MVERVVAEMSANAQRVKKLDVDVKMEALVIVAKIATAQRAMISTTTTTMRANAPKIAPAEILVTVAPIANVQTCPPPPRKSKK
jgi:hypothetical protein